MYKFINKYKIEKANLKKILEYNNKQVINPRDEDFVKAGYKELEIEQEPAFDEQIQYLDYYYVDMNDKILQKWEIKEIESGEM